MKIRALKAFTVRNSETGNLTSIANGAIAEVSDTLGSSLISDGLAEAYTLISPTGSVNITSNGTVDVAEYASAVVNVPGITPTGSIEITSNGTVDVTNYASAVVNVDGSDYATINFNLPALPPTRTTSPTALSEARSMLAATTVGNYALFGGGSGSSSSSSTVDAYDSNLEQQTPPAVLSQGRSELVATTVGNYALFGGGSYFSSSSLYFSSTVDAYDSNLEQQTPPAVLSQGKYRLAATTVGNYALFGGGYYSLYSSSTVDAYDSNLEQQTPPAGLSEGRNLLAATTVGNYALFGGGQGSSSSSSTVDAYDSNLEQQTPPAGLSEERDLLAATTVGNYALFGGGSGSSYSSTVDAYDSNLNKTTPLPAALSEAKYGLAATTIGNYALFGGGYYFSSYSHYYPLTLDVYDGNLNKQMSPAELSQGRDLLAATTVGNYALFGGGGNGPSNVVDAYIVGKYDVQLFPGTKYSFNGAAESTSSTWQTISVVGEVTGYVKVKNANIT